MRLVLIAAAISFVISIVAMPFYIKFLRRRRVGQEIREDGPQTHLVKHGTPTMGGVVFLTAATLAYVLSHLFFADSEQTFSVKGLLVFFAALGMGALGFIDDFLKFRNRRSLGLNKTGKIIGQVAISLIFAYLLEAYTSASTALSFIRPTSIRLPAGVFVLWVLLVLVATSNAVNLTDGLDGLAAGSSNFVFGAFALIAFWQFRHPQFYFPQVTGDTLQALDLAVVAAAFCGALGGFLWWNCAPAHIFMGDTGSLGLGGALAAMAFLTNTQLLLIVLGGLFVMETVSVSLQVFSFRVFHRRIFRMAPIHHHFELLGWPETAVIVRFWIIEAIFVIVGLGLFYGDWLASGAVKT